MLSLGHETLAPYAKADADGQPLFRLPGTPRQPVPFLSYASGAYMARMVEQIIKHAPTPPHLDPIYETDMAEGLKAMALEGHGLAFLPASSVRKEMRSKRLVAAGPSDYELTMEVRMYRERPESARHVKAAAQSLWDLLRETKPPG